MYFSENHLNQISIWTHKIYNWLFLHSLGVYKICGRLLWEVTVFGKNIFHWFDVFQYINTPI